jgi:hypothetical protein
MSPDLNSAVPALRSYLCQNVFISGGLAAAGYGSIARSLHPAVGLSAAAVSLGLGALCADDGFVPNDHLPQPHPLTGGQCAVPYLVVATVQLTNFQVPGTRTVIFSSSPNVAGPVGGFSWTPFPLVDNGQPRFWSLSVLDANGNQRGMSNAANEVQQDTKPGTVINANATRQDGQTGECGNLPGSTIEVIGDEDDVVPPGTIDFPSPSPGGPSLTLPIANFRVEKLFGVDGPLVNFDVGGVTVKVDFGQSPPEVTEGSDDLSRAISRIEDELEAQGDAIAEGDQNLEEVLSYLESIAQLLIQVRDCTCAPAVELESLWIPYVQCGVDESASEMMLQVQVPKDTVGSEQIQLLASSSELAVVGCEGHPVYAVPDSYNQRRQVSPPTLVLVYRRGNTRGYNSYSIPHPANTDPDQTILLTSFQKGQTLGSIYMSDNSSIQINCFSQSEAERVIDLLIPLVDTQFLPDPLEESYVQRRGSAIGTEIMTLSSYSYYSTGNRKLRADWITRVSGRP